MKKAAPLLLLLALTAGCSAYKPDLTADTITRKAISLNDKGICAGLSDKRGKEYCENALHDQLIFNSISFNGDVSLCNQIKDDQLKKSCTLVATSVQTKQAQDKQDRENLLKAQEGTDLKACDTLINDTAKSQCTTNIILRLAHDKKDAKLCDQITVKEIKSFCKSSVSK